MFNKLANQFAKALDNSDFDAALTCLDDNCIYYCRGKVYSGNKSIISEYRKNSDWAENAFENISYESSTETISDKQFKIHLTDKVSHKGHYLHHKSEQILLFNDSGLIERIEHIDLPGEREKAAKFFQDCGVTRN
ncbi:hypothetical protein KJ708_13650 [bacterium]|nr:hypothetical protein [bacterium]